MRFSRQSRNWWDYAGRRSTARLLLPLLGASLTLPNSTWAGSVGRNLDALPNLPKETLADFASLMGGAALDEFGEMHVFVPRIGKPLSNAPSPLLPSLRHPEQFNVPSGFSLVTWIKLDQAHPSGLLFGIGDLQGTYLTGVTDSQGAPAIVLFNGGVPPEQVCRASQGALNLADGKVHSIILLFNMASGLVRLYVDGAPEGVAVTNSWRLRNLGRTFILSCAALNTQGEADKAQTPRMLGRELSDEEVARLNPGNSDMVPADGRDIVEFVAFLRQLRS
ncbi:hypothetical protein BH09VER1_BH09VER1_07340 [soil metagenome]